MKSFSYVCPLALALVAAGGCSSAPVSSEATRQSTAAIQGGTNDTTHNFAVGIFLNLGGGEGAICSGALLAPNLVATARHCVAQLPTSSVSCGSTSFGSLYPLTDFVVTNASQITGTGTGVAKIITPTGANQTTVCGNDIALLILSKNITIPQYVEPAISPPITDHKTWATTVTAIGYGISTPTDQQGTTAGTRRIKEDIGLSCIPNDTTFVDCFSDPSAQSQMTASEFVGGDGTCEGDSGSSAYDQALFDAGTWASFGVLSRGGVSGSQCVGSIYSRFDAWSQLIIDAANEAATMGGYAPPAWAGGSSSSGGSSSGGSSSGSSSGSSGASSGGSGSGSSSGASTGLSDGTTCTADAQCANQNCVSHDGTNFVCASQCGSGNSCTAGASCISGYCFTDGPTSVSQHSGCAVAANPTDPVPWATVGLGAVAVAGLARGRRRRRSS